MCVHTFNTEAGHRVNIVIVILSTTYQVTLWKGEMHTSKEELRENALSKNYDANWTALYNKHNKNYWQTQLNKEVWFYTKVTIGIVANNSIWM